MSIITPEYGSVISPPLTVWKDQNGGGITLLDGYIVATPSMGPLESVLKNLCHGSGSLERAEVGSTCSVEHCQGYTTALTDADAERVTVAYALLFSSERAAERAAADYDQVADFLAGVRGIDIEDTEADGSFVVGRAIVDLRDGDRRSLDAGARPEPAARAPAHTQRAQWMDDCDDLGLSYDEERGINHLAELEFIVFGGARQCECVYDYLLAQYDPWQPPLLSDVRDHSLQVGLNVERYNSGIVTLRDESGFPSLDIPYYGHVEDLLRARNQCAGR